MSTPKQTQQQECAHVEIEQYNRITESIKSSVEGFGGKLTSMQAQLDAVDKKLAGPNGGSGSQRKSLRTIMQENESVMRLLKDRRGLATIVLENDDMTHALQPREVKTTITSSGVGYQTTGTLQIERIPGITIEPRAKLRIRDVLTANPTSLQIVDFVKVTTPPGFASPQPETSPKAENAVQFTSYSERIKTVATWIPATKQVLDDFAELAGYIENALPFWVNMAEEQGILLGDGVGENLHGIVPQSTNFNSGLLNPTAGWTRIDVLGRAVEQINMAAELDPSFVVLNPKDFWALRLTKDSYGRYILGDPMEVGSPNVFGLDLVSSTNMSAGSFLVGTGSPVGAEIRDRMSMQVEISTEYMDYFVKNMVAIRAEKRLAFVMKRNGSFITGAFNSSPIT
jgi:HK97 family phage major capsid protein